MIASDTFARELGVKFGVSGGYEDGNGNICYDVGHRVRHRRDEQRRSSNNRFTGRTRPAGASPGSIPAPTPGRGGIAVPNLADRLNVNMPVDESRRQLRRSRSSARTTCSTSSFRRAQTEGTRRSHLDAARDHRQPEGSGHQAGPGSRLRDDSRAAAPVRRIPTVNFKEAVLELKVTPTITAGRSRVSSTCNVKKDAIAGFIDNPGRRPGAAARQARDQHLGARRQRPDRRARRRLRSQQDRHDQRRCRSSATSRCSATCSSISSRNNTKAELLIFVTPRILNDSLK